MGDQRAKPRGHVVTNYDKLQNVWCNAHSNPILEIKTGFFNLFLCWNMSIFQTDLNVFNIYNDSMVSFYHTVSS
jgi:hypothetical protein